MRMVVVFANDQSFGNNCTDSSAFAASANAAVASLKNYGCRGKVMWNRWGAKGFNEGRT